MILLTELNKQLSSLDVEDLNITKDYINMIYFAVITKYPVLTYREVL